MLNSSTFVVKLGVIASVITILVFITGKSNVIEFFGGNTNKNNIVSEQRVPQSATPVQQSTAPAPQPTIPVPQPTTQTSVQTPPQTPTQNADFEHLLKAANAGDIKAQKK